MPSPKDIKNLLKTAQGTKSAGKAMDLEELLGTLPKGTKAQQLEAELMFRRLQEEQAARYAPTNPPTKRGNAALAEAKKTLTKKQAPAVIIPSKISNVERAVRESKGEYGARRVQRAADEIGDLERLYTEEALRQAFGGDNAKAFMTMNPEEFEKYAVPLQPRFMDQNSTRYTASGERLDYPEYMNEYLPNVGAFNDVPYLKINKEEQGLPLVPFISGHEGRHRNRVMANKGEKSGLVQLLPRAELREPFPRRDPEEYLEALRKELEMTGNMVLPERYIADEGDKTIRRPAIDLPDIYAEGGGVHMAGGGKALKVLKGADKAADATQDIQSIVSAGKPLTAAERAMVGRLAAEYTANQPVIRLSEALGNVGAEGKNLRVTQTDRTGAKYLGGAPFSMMQKVDPRYAQAKATWGVKTPSAAKNITNQSDAEVVWSTLIGSTTQHRSNELIFDKLYKAFQKSAKEGNLNDELRAKFNTALEPIFGEGADILNPKLRKEIDTFEKRAIVGNLLLGEGLGGAQRGGSIIPGTKIMAETTEPMLRDVETFSIGPRLFTLDQGVITRPDLHPAFPEILQGEDLNQLFTPVPNKIALPTFNEDFMARTGRKKPKYYDLTMTPTGQPYPTQFVDEDYLNFLQKEGYAHGGPVHMAGGNEPGESIGEMFKPKPLTIPSPLTDMADAIRRQFNKERRSMRKPGAATDILLRGPVAFAAGTPMDLVEMAGQGVDYLQTKIPSLRKNASAMDEPRSVVDKRPPDMGYAPKIKFGPDGVMPYGTEDFQNKLRQAGLTTDEERPLFELGTAIASPFAASKALKYGKAGAQALAPTAKDMLETQLMRATDPMRMNIVPDGGPSGKLKAPANDLGFYNPAEKAALNLQRKKGTGATFVSDLKKQPGVNDERLTELGLGDLASRPNVTKEELIAAADQNRIPLRETVRTEGGKSLEELNDDIYQLKEDMSYMDNDSREWAESDRALTRLEREYKQEETAGRAMFGPKTHADYNMPGGKNYREIRVGLPSNRPSIKDMSRDEYNAAVTKADAEGVNDFFNSTHHGDEPNVLFHLRVADHTDVEGKKGLLIDELQSDWHQKGRDKGYQGQLPEGAKVIYNKDINKYVVVKDGQTLDFGVTEQEAIKNASQKFGRVPDAPFKDNWYQLGLKRAIKEAADTGMDRVYLTTGQRQADRYDLSKQVDSLVLDKSGDGYLLTANRRGSPVINEEFTDPKKLESLIGKEASKKLLEKVDSAENRGGVQTGKLDGVDLKVGGEGMRQYYDKTYKNFLNKYAKQFGATVGETTLPSAGRKMIDLSSKEIDEITSAPGFIQEMMKLSGGKTAFQMSDNEYRRIFDAVLQKMRPEFGEKVYYIDITPKMRESSKKGQSYKDGGAVAMAAGGAVDYESRFNQMLQDHVAGMAKGGAVDYESRFNDMLQKHVQSMAEGGAVNEYNSDPDMADGGRFIQAPAFADGGAVKSIWTVN